MSKASTNSKSPPAIWKAGSVMPMARSRNSPMKANPSSTTTEMIVARIAWARRRSSESRGVMPTNTAAVPIGSRITSSATSEIRKVSRGCP